MKLARIFPVLLCLCILAGQNAWAHAPRARVGVFFGPVWSPFWYPSPWPYYPPPIVVAPAPPPPPPVYIEQSSGNAEATGDYWYFCHSARAYYPAVTTCPEDWLPVLPVPEK
ncbi:hypothetical protein BJN45_02105 [Azonexus hydrophilus]|uniref:Chitin-binding type-3 domain-containing protein n=1 Tax=Azonexus hydrophilus TaxID=418702 RepID=A0A1R1ICN5_9RHOO|nr:hypothetical protein [Azonexus hydrophilus]OMG56432.1 hypothetical protein BJN45_02105 [Azonexus hydrophilus]